MTPLTAIKQGAKTAPARIKPALILEQLDREWANLRQDDPSEDHEAVLRAYYHASVRVALYWIDFDPYTFAPPAAFHGERLYRLCLWLRSINPEDTQALKNARAAQLATLRGAAWENYSTLCVPVPDGSSQIDIEAPLYTWDAIDTLWQTEEYLKQLPADASASYLPKFSSKASEDWHLVCLAVLFLSRACKYALADLTLYTTGDGQ